MHLYAFGSICRGEISPVSDIDLLAIAHELVNPLLSPAVFTIYTYDRLRNLWLEGNPFAWHLFLESRLIFADDGKDYLANLGPPARYARGKEDCAKFYQLFREASEALSHTKSNVVFELSNIFLSIRNVAICYSLTFGPPKFSRHAARQLGTESLKIPLRAYSVLESARLLSSRGLGSLPSKADIRAVDTAMPSITQWILTIIKKVDHYE